MQERGDARATRRMTDLRAGSAPVEWCRLQAGEYALEFITLGAAITRLQAPDRAGNSANVVLGHARLADYGQGRDYFGAVIGRLANRLRNGRLRIDGGLHALTVNDGSHHLHGGVAGFDRRPWQLVVAAVRGQRACAMLERVSPDGEEGYPGELRARVDYAVAADGVIEVVLRAETDRTTVVNLTNHSYFNLRGEGEGHVLSHWLTIAADRFCVIDTDLIPTGELRPVPGTAFDFRQSKPIGRDIAARDPQLQIAGGYDHCMVLGAPTSSSAPPPPRAGRLRRACELYEPGCGRRLEIWTDQPGAQLYSGNFLHEGIIGSQGRAYCRHAGICVETQRFPDAPNHPQFPAVELHRGESYLARTVWRFSH